MYELFKIDNGLRVVAEKINHVNSISAGVWIENGSRNENKDNNGISHFIEHMFFKGTNNRTSKELAEAIENVGGQINAFTGKEATCFYIKALDTHLELTLDVLSDMLFNSKFDEEHVEKEKSVISEEINMNEDSPEDVLMDVHSKAIWGNESISLPILGTKNTINSFTGKQLKKYVEEYYIPENCVISICGKFDEKEIGKLIEKYFGNWSSNNKKITRYSKPEIQNNFLFRHKNIEQLHINMGLKGISLGDDDIYPLVLLCNVLGGGASSLLFQKIREELGLCYSIYAYSSSMINTGIVSIYSALNPNVAGEAIEAIKNSLEKFSQYGLSDERLRIAKEQLKGSYMLGLESTSSKMFSNGRSALFLNKINTPENILNKIDNIDKKMINRVLHDNFNKGIMNCAFVGSSCEEVNKAINGKIEIINE